MIKGQSFVFGKEESEALSSSLACVGGREHGKQMLFVYFCLRLARQINTTRRALYSQWQIVAIKDCITRGRQK